MGLLASSGAVEPVVDLVELLERWVLEDGGRVDEVRGAPARRLEALGGVAALLRFARAPAR